MTFKGKLVSRNDTEANWISNNPVLLLGEIGIATDVKKLKVGDGTSTWTQLTYYMTSGTGGGVTDYTELSNKPQIGGIELTGNKSLATLGIASTSDLTGVQNDIVNIQTLLGNINLMFNELLGVNDVASILDALNGEVI